MNYNLLVSVLHLEQLFAIVDGELRQHGTRPKNFAVSQDVVAEDLGEDPPGLQPSV